MPPGRTRRTARILTRSLYGEAVRAVRARSGSSSRGTAHAQQQQRAHTIRATLEELGPLYVKVGQILATRPDLVPEHVREELAQLNDEATAEPFAAFEPILDEELGPDWRRRYPCLRTGEPLGAASLAQVYKATTADGTPCVIKIQRPGARAAVEADMKVLRRAARALGTAAPRLKEVVNPQAVLEALFTVMQPELDFTREATNMKAARKAAKRFRRLSVPKVLEATPRVLVQTFADGVPINKIKPHTLTRKQRTALARDLITFMLRSYFVQRTFHADPHPGNILVSEAGTAHLIDWGMVGKIDRNTSTAFLGAFLALAHNDGAGMARQWINLGSATAWSDVAGFISDVSAAVPHWADASLDELNFGVALTAVLRYSTSRGIQVTPLVSVVGKSVANIEGSVRCICPDIKLSQALHEALRDILRDLLSEVLSTEQVARAVIDGLTAVAKAPTQMQALLGDLAARQFTVQSRTNLGVPKGKQPLPHPTSRSVLTTGLTAAAAAALTRNRIRRRT
ncbi:ABC1 kinase family protein [Streptomyces sp. NPDC017529]|uniref:ABC1 kinase family protein n=1 Tax=Streptomyces sp. NPDC017529 TaxID=3365000 RepID=UPI0037B019C8